MNKFTAFIKVSTSPDGSTPADIFKDPKDPKLLEALKKNKRGSLVIENPDGSLKRHVQEKLNVLIPKLESVLNGRFAAQLEYDRKKTASKRERRGLPPPLVFEG